MDKRNKVIENKLNSLIEYFNTTKIKLSPKSSLFSGLTGVFLFRLYAQQYLKTPNTKLETDLVDFVTEQISNPISITNYCNGIGGFAWFINHIKSQNFVAFNESLLHDFDEVIFKAAKAHFSKKNHDYLHGALGLMLCLAERAIQSKTCAKNLTVLIDDLIACATTTDTGIYWYESDIMLDEKSKENKVINLHISHGQAGKIVVLAKALKAGITQAKEPLQKAVNYLLSLKSKRAKKALVPYVIINGNKEEFTSLGWCRGNISISIALYLAANVLNDQSLKINALEIANKTIKLKSIPTASIHDPALCHGAAGLSQMYLRLHFLTGEQSYKKAANNWMDSTIQMAQFKTVPGGFMSIDGYSKQWEPDFSLLTGSAGIGLALISHLTNKPLSWDSCLLLS